MPLSRNPIPAFASVNILETFVLYKDGIKTRIFLVTEASGKLRFCALVSKNFTGIETAT